MLYIVDFTHEDKSEKLHETTDKAAATEFAKRKQVELSDSGKHGVISVYTVTTERGKPMQKCIEFFKV